MLIIGAALCAVSCFLYKFSAVIFFLLAIRILHGFGFGIHSTSGATVVADIIPRTRMSEGLGIFGLYGTIASAIAPAIALGIIGDGESNDVFIPLFMLAAGIAVVCMILDSLIRYERREKSTEIKAQTPVSVAEDQNNGPASKGFFGLRSRRRAASSGNYMCFYCFFECVVLFDLVC